MIRVRLIALSALSVLTLAAATGATAAAESTSLSSGSSEAWPPTPEELMAEAEPTEDVIEWTGATCENRRLHIRLVVSPDVSRKNVVVGNDDTDECNFVAGAVETVLAEPHSEASLVSEPLLLDEMSSSCTAYGNFAHTSHTYQDIVNIDLGWIRTTFDRKWNCNTAWWGEDLAGENLVAWSGVSGDFFYWNADPPVMRAWSWGCSPTGFAACDGTLGQAEMSVRVGGLCRYSVISSVRTYISGNFTVDWYQTGGCPGIHSATGTSQNTSRAGGFGGTGLFQCAIPNTRIDTSPPTNGQRSCTPTRLP